VIEQLIDNLMIREGGYANRKADRGGPTNMGITLNTLKRYRGGILVTDQDVAALTKEEVRKIYRKFYWLDPGFNNLKLSDDLVELLFDSCVHHGEPNAVKMLQRAAGVKDDGQIGPTTQKVVEAYDDETLAARFVGERLMFIIRLVKKDPTQLENLGGWGERIREFIVRIPND
jgi:lysozyme family protein